MMSRDPFSLRKNDISDPLIYCILRAIFDFLEFFENKTGPEQAPFRNSQAAIFRPFPAFLIKIPLKTPKTAKEHKHP